jgi:hypothetical protein
LDLEGALQPSTLDTVMPGNSGISNQADRNADNLLGRITALTSIMLLSPYPQTTYIRLAIPTMLKR